MKPLTNCKDWFGNSSRGTSRKSAWPCQKHQACRPGSGAGVLKVNPSPPGHRCKPCPNSRACSVPAARGQVSPAPHKGVLITQRQGLRREGPFGPSGICAPTVSRCRAPLSRCRAGRQGAPRRGAARTCCCPPRRALCRDAGALTSPPASLLTIPFIYLFICSFIYLLI